MSEQKMCTKCGIKPAQVGGFWKSAHHCNDCYVDTFFEFYKESKGLLRLFNGRKAYKGIKAEVAYDPDDKIYYGKLILDGDLVTFETKTIDDLQTQYELAVDDYLETCEKFGRPPVVVAEENQQDKRK